MRRKSRSKPKKPRKRPAPSRRNQEIFLAYEISGKTQEQIAADTGLTQSRVSAIIRGVRQWRARSVPAEEAELTPLQQQRLDYHLERERLLLVSREALRAYHHQPKSLKTDKQGTRGGQTYDETVDREQPPNVPLLKLVVKANSDLGKLHEREPLPDDPAPADSGLSQWEREDIMWKELVRQRTEAEECGSVVASGSPEGLVLNWLCVLTSGDTNNDSPCLKPAARELSRNILPWDEQEAAVQSRDQWSRSSGEPPDQSRDQWSRFSDGAEGAAATSATYAAIRNSSQDDANESLTSEMSAEEISEHSQSAGSWLVGRSRASSRKNTRQVGRSRASSPRNTRTKHGFVLRAATRLTARCRAWKPTSPIPAGVPRPRIPLWSRQRVQAHLAELRAEQAEITRQLGPADAAERGA